jgi:O-antigen ligase
VQSRSGWGTQKFLSMDGLGPVAGFVVLGFIAGVVLSLVAAFWNRHGGHHYRDILLIATFTVGPPFLYYNFAAVRQGYRSLVVMLKKLRWYHFLWLLLFISAQTWRMRTLAETKQTPVDEFAASRAIMVTVAGCYLLYRLFTRKTDFLHNWFRGIPGLLMVFALAALTSTLWSVYWPWTMYKSCEYAVDVAALTAIITSLRNTEDYKRWFDWTWLFLGMLLLACWIGAYFDPETALSRLSEEGGAVMGPIPVQLMGVFPVLSANRVGEYSAILAAVALVRLLPVRGIRRIMKTWYTWLLLAALVTMFFAQTRSATGGFLIALVLIFWLSGRFKHGLAIVLIGLSLLLVTGTGGFLIDYMKRGQTTAQMESLTGRIVWWEFAWHKYTDAPFTGYGAYAAGKFLVMGSMGNNIASVHSDWVETLVGCGWWGVFPLIAVMGVGWWYLLRFVLDPQRTPEERQLALEAIAVFTIASVRTFFSDDLIWHVPLQFWVVLGYAEYLRQRYASSPSRISAPAYIGR